MKPLKELATTSLKSYKWFWMAIAILLVTNLYFYVSNLMTVNKHNKELVLTKQQYEEKVKMTLDKNAKEQLSLMLKTFVWAVRSSMIRSNMDEVDQYFTELIQEQNIHEIVLAGRDGNMLVSTNKKHQSKSFSSFYPASILKEQDIFFTHSEDGNEYYVAAPVLSLNNRLGTLFLIYATDNFNLETKPLPVVAAVSEEKELPSVGEPVDTSQATFSIRLEK